MRLSVFYLHLDVIPNGLIYGIKTKQPKAEFISLNLTLFIFSRDAIIDYFIVWCAVNHCRRRYYHWTFFDLFRLAIGA